MKYPIVLEVDPEMSMRGKSSLLDRESQKVLEGQWGSETEKDAKTVCQQEGYYGGQLGLNLDGDPRRQWRSCLRVVPLGGEEAALYLPALGHHWLRAAHGSVNSPALRPALCSSQINKFLQSIQGSARSYWHVQNGNRPQGCGQSASSNGHIHTWHLAQRPTLGTHSINSNNNYWYLLG